MSQPNGSALQLLRRLTDALNLSDESHGTEKKVLAELIKKIRDLKSRPQSGP